MNIRKAKKLNKSFGPMIKLNVPDFDKINKHYETLQKERDGAKKKGKHGATHKFNLKQKYDTDNPDMDNPETNDMQEEMKEPRGGGLQPPRDYLTQPKQAKQIDNPWIDKEVNEEVLDKEKRRPARAIIKNNAATQAKVRLAYANAPIIKGNRINKTDEQTTEALKLLEEENQIFTTPDLPPTSFLPRFDLQSYEEEEKIPEILKRCQDKPDQIHGLSPTYENYEYVWRPVYVLDYVNKRWKVRDQATGNIKYVTRLSLLFLDEDPNSFTERVKDCKTLQKNVNEELMFTALVDSISPDNVSILSKERRFNLLKKCMRDKTDVGHEKVAGTLKKLLRVIEEEYVRQMKKCIILNEMKNPSSMDRFKSLKIPVRLSARAAPYLGVALIPKYDYTMN